MGLKKTVLTDEQLAARDVADQSELVPQTPIVADKPEEKADVDDPRYFELSEPINIGGRGETVISKLLVDPTDLKGPTYFRLAARFRAEYPEIYKNSFNKLGEEAFLALVLAELNPPMIESDVNKICFVDLPPLFMRMQVFAFSKRVKKMATA